MESADLDQQLAHTSRVYVDSSTCIAYHSRTELVHSVARHLFERIADGADPLIGYLSVVSVAEMLVRPIRSGGRDLTMVHAFVQDFPNLEVLQVDLSVALQAANIRALTSIAMPDALLIGTALLSGCEAIISNDQRWTRRLAPLFPQFSWIYLGS